MLKNKSTRPVVFGCAGLELTTQEADFFASAQPLGFVFFARNFQDSEQFKQLINDLKEAVGSEDLLFCLDHEGGRVQRMRQPHCRSIPPAKSFGDLYKQDPDAALNAVEANAKLMARELSAWGVNLNFAPVLDVLYPETHAAIGDRAFSDDPKIIVTLAEKFAETLLSEGIYPVIKHMPGHGRATVDSHHNTPVIYEDLATLKKTDFLTFKALNFLPLGMTAHIVLSDLDPDQPTTLSKSVIQKVIREEIGFEGLLFSDDLNMKALQGSAGELAAKCLQAGCDIALHCDGNLAEMQDIASKIPVLTHEELERFNRHLALPKPKADNQSEAELQMAIEKVMVV